MIVGNRAKIKLDGEHVDRNLGWFSKDGKTFYTTRKPQHWFKIFQGFGFNSGLLEDLIDKGVEMIVLFYKKFNGKNWVNEHVYHITPWKAMTEGTEYRAEDFEPQIIVKKTSFDEYKDEVKI
jgi:hypothetical protein